MVVARRFLLASSLTRLIRKECGSERITEGHFPAQAGRQSHIHIERGQCHLVLTSVDDDLNATEDWTEVPRAHAEALLEVCPGTIVFERSRLRMRNFEVLIDRFITPGQLDLLTVEFASQPEADAFMPPVWFGSEVTQDDAYTNRVIAIVGRPRAPETPLSNAALETALDLLESRSEETYYAPAEPQVEDSAFDRLRRLAAMRPGPTVAPVSPPAPEPNEEKPAEAVAPFKSRRPTIQIAPGPDKDEDDRLAGVIQGLSEALSQAPAAKEPSEPSSRSKGKARE
jgi:CYTH domain-containing protein